MDEQPIKEREITFTLKVKHLKQSAYYLIIIVLLIALVLQYFHPSCSRCSTTDSQQAGVASETSSESVALESSTEEIVEEVVDEPEEEVIEETATENETIENETIEDESEVEVDLEITGEVFVVIDEINYVIKDVDDYARVTSVTFTIKNQDVDFIPKVVGYLTWDIDDEKEISLVELKAGKSITTTETKLAFGYKNIDEEKKLILKVYDKKNKLQASAEKTFMTS